VHNLASCYHHLGEFDVAQVLYEFAIGDFCKAGGRNPAEAEEPDELLQIFKFMPTVDNVNSRRLRFSQQRLQMLNDACLPPIDVYLDETGTEYRRHESLATDENGAIAAAEDLCSRARPIFSTIPNALRVRSHLSRRRVALDGGACAQGPCSLGPHQANSIT
jgi:hypothetical protein